MKRKLDRIVDEAVLRWEHEQHVLAHRAPSHQLWPIITISREYGAHGTEVGQALAERIGFTLWDKALVQAIAEASGGDETVVATLDKRRRHALDEAVQELLSGGRHANVTYHRTLLRVVHAIAARGGSIVLGRGANFICAKLPHVSVRIVAPFDVRARAYAKHAGVTVLEARKFVAAMDEERLAFVRDHFHRNAGDPSHYDLVVNSQLFTVDQIVDVILTAYEKRVGRRPVPVHEPNAVHVGHPAGVR